MLSFFNNRETSTIFLRVKENMYEISVWQNNSPRSGHAQALKVFVFKGEAKLLIIICAFTYIPARFLLQGVVLLSSGWNAKP